MRPISRGWRIALIGVAAAIPLFLLVIAAFPWGILQSLVADRLQDRFGRAVTIGSFERVDRFGFTPRIAVSGVRIPQADWAGRGDFATIARAEASFPVWPLLTGTFRPRDIRVTGLRLALVRDRNGRTNWSRPGKPETGGASTDLKGLTVVDSVIRYRDARRDRQATLAFTSDAKGLRASGPGIIRGAPVRITVIGDPVAQPTPGPWPFTARIDGALLAMTAKGRMDRPLDTDRMTLAVTARADDLRLIDAVIEAGLFGTQPVRIAATVRHDAPDWVVTGLAGTIGRSDLAGDLTVRKRDGRTRIDGTLASRRFDFNDLSGDEGLAEGAALERRVGLRVVPNTRIDLTNLDNIDGTLAFRIGRIINRPITSLSGHATLDRRRLTIAPIAMGVADGMAKGKVTIDQRGGAAMPTLTVELTLRSTSVPAMAGGGGDFTGTITAHGRLVGRGETVRAAIGRSDGHIGFVVRDGALPGRYAAALGFDAGRALLQGSDDRAGLRCVILGLDVRGGTGRASPLIVDTTLSQLNGQGAVSFPAERVDLRFTGAPKRASLLRLPGFATMTGTIREPDFTVPPEVKSARNIFKAIGRAITGNQGPRATDADCGTLAARVLR